MGKTTNTLLSAGDFALDGETSLDSLRTMHLNAANALGLPNSTVVDLLRLLDEAKTLLEGNTCALRFLSAETFNEFNCMAIRSVISGGVVSKNKR